MESDNDRMFRERAEALALKIALALWRCNGTQYRNAYLDGMEQIGIDRETACGNHGIGIACQFIQCRILRTLFVEDLEIAERKLKKVGAIEVHAYLERLARARYQRKVDAGAEVLRMMNDFTATAERMADDEIEQAKRDA